MNEKRVLMTTWHDVIGEEKEKEYFKKVRLFEREERSRHQVFPKAENVFKALELTPFDQVKVVILGKPLITEIIKRMDLVFQCNKVWHFRLLCKTFIRN